MKLESHARFHEREDPRERERRELVARLERHESAAYLLRELLREQAAVDVYLYRLERCIREEREARRLRARLADLDREDP